MKKSYLAVFVFFLVHFSFAQYWFGPKAGINYLQPIYQDKTVEDRYDISNDLDFHAGVAFNYTASNKYSVYAELLYERVNRKLENKSENPIVVQSEVTNHLISLPVMLRITFARSGPVHYFVNGGPKISYWAAGNGSIYVSSFQERPPDPDTGEELGLLPDEYRITFNSRKNNAEDIRWVSQANRIQFGLTVGGGAVFDLRSGARLMVDARYAFGHSNFGFDSANDIWFQYPDDEYVESFEYSLNTLSVSVGYFIEYNAELKRKGKSTNKKSNKKRK